MKSTIMLLTLLPVLLSCNSVQASREAADDESMINDPRVQHRSYTFEPTGETLPYALFVPGSYQQTDGSVPLIVSLHGLGRTYDWLMGYEGFLDYAEQYGFMVVTPLGYVRRGWYGSRPTEDPLHAQYSEADVMAVIDQVKTEFNVDAERTYLWGHSMGGAGTYHIAVNNPDMFAALAVAAPAPHPDQSPTILSEIRDTPILVLQGTEDELVSVEMTRHWVAAMRSVGMPHVYVELEGADHSSFIAQNRENMRKVVNFFDTVGARR
ncbi:MAG: alpha/beta fold hydrolase [Pseudohongiella sp.]|uniref:carboxylesterase family protein n=1 Tax=Pseudohongiella sp. TaxID=1979412 RepID=UPI0034A0326A